MVAVKLVKVLPSARPPSLEQAVSIFPDTSACVLPALNRPNLFYQATLFMKQAGQ
jgi:hypothetical protein